MSRRHFAQRIEVLADTRDRQQQQEAEWAAELREREASEVAPLGERVSDVVSARARALEASAWNAFAAGREALDWFGRCTPRVAADVALPKLEEATRLLREAQGKWAEARQLEGE